MFSVNDILSLLVKIIWKYEEGKTLYYKKYTEKKLDSEVGVLTHYHNLRVSKFLTV